MNQAATTEQPSGNPDQTPTSLSQQEMSAQQSLTNNTGMEAKVQHSSPTSEAGADQTDQPNLDLIMKIPVTVQVILGTTKMPVAKLMKLGRNAVIPLDRQVGDPIDVVVNGRTVARGEVVLMEDDSSRFGISLTEIVGPNAEHE